MSSITVSNPAHGCFLSRSSRLSTGWERYFLVQIFTKLLFPTFWMLILIRLKSHHFQELKGGKRRNYEWETEERDGVHYNRLKRVFKYFNLKELLNGLQILSCTWIQYLEIVASSSQVVQLSTASIKSLTKRSISIWSRGSCISSHWHWLFLLLLLLLAFLVASAYSYINCDLTPTPEERQYRLLDIQYASLPDSLKKDEEEILDKSENKNVLEKEETSYERPGGYFPARLSQNSSQTPIKTPETNVLSASFRRSSNRTRAGAGFKVLTKDCVLPLIALVAAVIALLLYVLALLVIIANCFK